MCHGRHYHRVGFMDAPAPRRTRDLDDDMRVADEDRERTVAQLREHHAQGRLTVEELEERTERAWAARFGRDLKALRADLPRVRLPEERRRRALGARAEADSHPRTYLGVMLLLVAIWALTGAGYFWPIWPMIGWGIGVFSHWLPVRRATRSHLPPLLPN